jgi:hypothetical protein
MKDKTYKLAHQNVHSFVSAITAEEASNFIKLIANRKKFSLNECFCEVMIDELYIHKSYYCFNDFCGTPMMSMMCRFAKP